MDEESQTATLKIDIISTTEYHKVLAHKGDKVTVISDHDNVQIAEGPDGRRFPVPTDELAGFERKEAY